MKAHDLRATHLSILTVPNFRNYTVNGEYAIPELIDGREGLFCALPGIESSFHCSRLGLILDCCPPLPEYLDHAHSAWAS